MCCGVGCRCGSDPMLLWLWSKPAAAVPIWPLSLETSICHRGGPKKQTNKQTKNSKAFLKELPIILISFPEFPKIFNQHTPEMFRDVQFSLWPVIFLHNPSLMSAVTRVEYWPALSARIRNFFLTSYLGPNPPFPNRLTLSQQSHVLNY